MKHEERIRHVVITLSALVFIGMLLPVWSLDYLAPTPGTSYCVLCLAETFGMATAAGYVDIARALRRVGTYQPDRYDTFQGKCVTHTGPRGAGTFWVICAR